MFWPLCESFQAQKRETVPLKRQILDGPPEAPLFLPLTASHRLPPCPPFPLSASLSFLRRKPLLMSSRLCSSIPVRQASLQLTSDPLLTPLWVSDMMIYSNPLLAFHAMTLTPNQLPSRHGPGPAIRSLKAQEMIQISSDKLCGGKRARLRHVAFFYVAFWQKMWHCRESWQNSVSLDL